MTTDTVTQPKPSGRENKTDLHSKVYVRGLPNGTTEADLSRLAEQYGTVLSVRVILDKMTQEPLGYGFVRFANLNEAQAAVSGLAKEGFATGYARREDLAEVLNKFEDPDNTNCYIANLPSFWDDKSLYNEFSKFGEVLQVRVLVNRQGKSRGIGFARLGSRECARRAIAALNGAVPENGVFPLICKFADTDRQRVCRLNYRETNTRRAGDAGVNQTTVNSEIVSTAVSSSSSSPVDNRSQVSKKSGPPPNKKPHTSSGRAYGAKHNNTTRSPIEKVSPVVSKMTTSGVSTYARKAQPSSGSSSLSADVSNANKSTGGVPSDLEHLRELYPYTVPGSKINRTIRETSIPVGGVVKSVANQPRRQGAKHTPDENEMNNGTGVSSLTDESENMSQEETSIAHEFMPFRPHGNDSLISNAQQHGANALNTNGTFNGNNTSAQEQQQQPNVQTQAGVQQQNDQPQLNNNFQNAQVMPQMPALFFQNGQYFYPQVVSTPEGQTIQLTPMQAGLPSQPMMQPIQVNAQPPTTNSGTPDSAQQAQQQPPMMASNDSRFTAQNGIPQLMQQSVMPQVVMIQPGQNYMQQHIPIVVQPSMVHPSMQPIIMGGIPGPNGVNSEQPLPRFANTNMDANTSGPSNTVQDSESSSADPVNGNIASNSQQHFGLTSTFVPQVAMNIGGLPAQPMQSAPNAAANNLQFTNVSDGIPPQHLLPQSSVESISASGTNSQASSLEPEASLPSQGGSSTVDVSNEPNLQNGGFQPQGFMLPSNGYTFIPSTFVAQENIAVSEDESAGSHISHGSVNSTHKPQDDETTLYPSVPAIGMSRNSPTVLRGPIMSPTLGASQFTIMSGLHNNAQAFDDAHNISPQISLPNVYQGATWSPNINNSANEPSQSDD